MRTYFDIFDTDSMEAVPLNYDPYEEDVAKGIRVLLIPLAFVN